MCLKYLKNSMNTWQDLTRKQNEKKYYRRCSKAAEINKRFFRWTKCALWINKLWVNHLMNFMLMFATRQADSNTVKTQHTHPCARLFKWMYRLPAEILFINLNNTHTKLLSPFNKYFRQTHLHSTKKTHIHINIGWSCPCKNIWG